MPGRVFLMAGANKSHSDKVKKRKLQLTEKALRDKRRKGNSRTWSEPTSGTREFR